MVAIPSGTPIPTPTAVGRLVEDSWIWAGTAGPVDVLAGEFARTVVAIELGPVEKVVVTGLLDFMVGADGEGVSGGNPRIEPPV